MPFSKIVPFGYFEGAAMKSVYDALDPIVNGSITEIEKGTKYEAACIYFLKSDPYWSDY